MVSAKPILTVDRLTKVYATSDGELHALEEVSFQVNKGEFVCLVSPSGCGKTTLLRILGGLLKPQEGKVYVKGTPLMGPRREIGEDRPDRFRKPVRSWTM